MIKKHRTARRAPSSHEWCPNQEGAEQQAEHERLWVPEKRRRLWPFRRAASSDITYVWSSNDVGIFSRSIINIILNTFPVPLEPRPGNRKNDKFKQDGVADLLFLSLVEVLSPLPHDKRAPTLHNIAANRWRFHFHDYLWTCSR